MMPLPEMPYDEWFDDSKSHPHDSMPIASDNPRPEEEIADAMLLVISQHLNLKSLLKK